MVRTVTAPEPRRGIVPLVSLVHFVGAELFGIADGLQVLANRI